LNAEEFEKLWLQVLHNLNWILKQREEDDMLADQVHEATKNLFFFASRMLL